MTAWSVLVSAWQQYDSMVSTWQQYDSMDSAGQCMAAISNIYCHLLVIGAVTLQSLTILEVIIYQ
jgi:hypothetical protein